MHSLCDRLQQPCESMTYTFRDWDTDRSLMKAEDMNGWKAFKGS